MLCPGAGAPELGAGEPLKNSEHERHGMLGSPVETRAKFCFCLSVSRTF